MQEHGVRLLCLLKHRFQTPQRLLSKTIVPKKLCGASTRNIRSSSHRTFAKNLLSETNLEQLSSGQVVVLDTVLGEVQAHKCALQAVATASSLNSMAVGRGYHQSDGSFVRGDQGCWLEKDGSISVRGSPSTYLGPRHTDCYPALKQLHHFFDQLRRQLNRTTFLGLTHFDCQIACYPGDGISGYDKHLDAFQTGSHNRAITAIYYLNMSWQVENGGQLRVWQCQSETKKQNSNLQDIDPFLDRLVLFRSCKVQHQVMPSIRDRWAATAWFYSAA